MVIRSICIWVAVSIIWCVLMNPIVSRSAAHDQRLAEIEKQITEVREEYQREENKKSALLKRRDELSKKIEREIENGEQAKSLVKKK